MTDETEKKQAAKELASAFVYVEDDKRPSLLTLNERARGLAADRRADMDTAHDSVVKAVGAAFGKTRAPKPIVPKGSGHGAQLRADAAKAAKEAGK